jgi:hypothetical protein
MNRRRGGRSRRDRYGIDEEEGKNGEDASTPYQLHTEAATSVSRPQEPPATAVINKGVVSRREDAPATTTASVASLRRPGIVDTDAVPEEVEPLTPSNNNNNNQDVFRDEPEGDDDGDDDGESYIDYDMTLQELMYSTSSFYAIVVPGKLLRDDLVFG